MRKIFNFAGQIELKLLKGPHSVNQITIPCSQRDYNKYNKVSFKAKSCYLKDDFYP